MLPDKRPKIWDKLDHRIRKHKEYIEVTDGEYKRFCHTLPEELRKHPVFIILKDKLIPCQVFKGIPVIRSRYLHDYGQLTK